MSVAYPADHRLEIVKVVDHRLVDKQGQSRLDEGAGAFDMLVADIGRDDDGIDLADDVGGILHHVGNARALRDMLGGEAAVADAADMRDGRARDAESLLRFLVQVGGDAGEGAFARHPFAVVAVEDGAPGVGMAVAGRAADHSQTQRGTLRGRDGKGCGSGCLPGAHCIRRQPLVAVVRA